MSKCRIIDRLAFTKGVVRVIGEGEQDRNQAHSPPPSNQHFGEICPECGKHTLVPEAGCWTCRSCGWSKCDLKGSDTF